MYSIFHPELGEHAAPYEIAARLSWDGKHWFIDTFHDLKGRGIRYSGEASRPGWKTYFVTNAAFETLKQKYAIVSPVYLD